MNRFFGTVFLGFVLCANVFAQTGQNHSLGSIPPYFSIPPENAKVRFTSHEQPVFATPVYPEALKNKGIEGVVEVEAFVTSEGEVVYSEIAVSSGDEDFDEAALKSAMKTKFPAGFAMYNGAPSDFSISIPYYFLLSADPEQYWHSRLELARIQQEYDKLMGTFQSYITQRTAVSKETMQTTRKHLEEKIALAKNIHHTLAEKKESAILRLRNEITETKATIENDDTILRDPDKRFANIGTGNCEVRVALPQTGIVTLSCLRSDKPLLEKLASEIELKKSYL